MLRRFGLAGVLLLALTTVTLGTEVQACAPSRVAGHITDIADVAAQADACSSQECQDCGLACAHGCCHAQHVAVTSLTASPLAPMSFKSPASWTEDPGAPYGAPSGLERPPRA